MRELRPFFKWAGGKDKSLTTLRPLLPPKPWRSYRESFLGGGALFWAECPLDTPAILSDTNSEIIDTYLAVRDHLEELLGLLRMHERQHHAAPTAYYYAVRAVRPAALRLVERAARMYLNRTCMNGLYRLNSDGEFNVSLGDCGPTPIICREERLRPCSARLQGVDLLVADFAAIVRAAREGDVIYLDPPYVPVSATSSFTQYTAGGFGRGNLAQRGLFDALPEGEMLMNDHVRIPEELAKLDGQGVRWMLSNSDTPVTRELYARWHITGIQAARSINTVGTKRGPVGEIVVRNYV